MVIYLPLGSKSNFHIRKQSHKGNGIVRHIKVMGKKDTLRECSKCHKLLSPNSFNLKGSKNSSGYFYLFQWCKGCKKISKQESTQVKKTAPPLPSHCQCCHKKTEKMTHDHEHGTITLRGFLCNGCNVGIGYLGDDLKGVLQGAIYLENDINKIIETLHTVYDEMFARTNTKSDE